MSLTIRNARIPFRPGLWDIRVEAGMVERVSGAGEVSAVGEVLDAAGGLVSPPFVDAHLHLDKVYTAEGSFGGFSSEIIPRLRELKRGFREEDVLRRGRRALLVSAAQGTLAVRAFVDVDPVVGLKCLRAALTLKEELRGLLELQVVAFPQEGLSDDPEKAELLWRAAELGADAVGAIPWYEQTPEDSLRHIDAVFEVAKSFGRPIHVVADDTDDPFSTNLLRVAHKALREGLAGRVAASQCRGALDSSNEAYARRVIALVKEASISVVECPHTSLMLSGGPGPHPSRRGVTRVAEFAAAGVNVAAGQDDIQDMFYPFGRGSMVEVGFLLVHAARLLGEEGLRLAYRAITQGGATLMGLAGYGLQEGCRADLLVFEQKTVQQVFSEAADPAYVVRAGRVVAKNSKRSELYGWPAT